MNDCNHTRIESALNGDECAQCLRDKARSALAPPAGSPAIDDLAMLVRRLCLVLHRLHPYHPTGEKARDYLKRHGLSGSPLKSEQPPPAVRNTTDYSKGGEYVDIIP